MYIDVNQLRETISIRDFLAALGFQPVRLSGKEYFYHSMIRDSDSTPSFCVNDRQGYWFDHGCGRGGTLIDLAKCLWPAMPFNQLLNKIAETVRYSPEPTWTPGVDKIKPEKEPNCTILEIREPGSNPIITDYMQLRGVWGLDNPGYKEVYYAVEDYQGKQNRYFAAGWQNEKGGWEVRNRYFKGCIGPKAITWIPGNPARLAVFEGFIDYLSCRKDRSGFSDTAMVLNGTAQVGQVKDRAAGFSSVSLFLDFGKGGRQATSRLLWDIPQATDESAAYQGFDDYNEKLMSMLDHRSEFKMRR